jgi:hypothetical protein
MKSGEVLQPEEYERKAEEAEERARKCGDKTARETFEEIARNWREMALLVRRMGL